MTDFDKAQTERHGHKHSKRQDPRSDPLISIGTGQEYIDNAHPIVRPFIYVICGATIFAMLIAGAAGLTLLFLLMIVDKPIKFVSRWGAV